MSTDRIGDWGVAVSGRQFWPLDPRPEDFHIEDIAHALAHLCRYGGHSRSFYSVAEHSVLVSTVVPREHALAALMHDATEAYVVDVPRPLKRGLGAAYADIEARVWAALAERFGLPLELPECVKHADDAVLMAEKEVLLPAGGPQWSVNAAPADVQIWCEPPLRARDLFLRTFRKLGGTT